MIPQNLVSHTARLLVLLEW